MKKRIALSILILLLIPGVLYVSWNQFSDKNESPDTAILQAITKEFPIYSSTVRLDSVSEHEDTWYIATIAPVKPTEQSVPVKILLSNQANEGLKVILGPDIYFSKREILAYDLPDSVITILENTNE